MEIHFIIAISTFDILFMGRLAFSTGNVKHLLVKGDYLLSCNEKDSQPSFNPCAAGS